jgi:hypothetical protein
MPFSSQDLARPRTGLNRREDTLDLFHQTSPKVLVSYYLCSHSQRVHPETTVEQQVRQELETSKLMIRQLQQEKELLQSSISLSQSQLGEAKSQVQVLTTELACLRAAASASSEKVGW